MVKLRNILKDNLNQIFAIAEKNVKLRLRVKSAFIMSFITPFLNIIMPLIILWQLFTFTEGFGPWNNSNFVIFQITAYHLLITFSILNVFPSQLKQEKYWRTLPALIIAPFKRVNLLIGIYVSHLISISVPFIIFFVIGFIYMHFSIFTFFSLLIVYFLISLIFTGIGLIFGVFAVSKENLQTPIRFLLNIVFIFTTLSLPFEFFPGYFQNFVVINPINYIIDIARLVWIEDNILFTLLTHPIHFILLILGAISIPFIGLYIFNYVFDKYGIQGY